MKKLFFYLSLLVFLISCKQTYIITPAGRKMSERKFNRITKRIVKKVVNDMSKEDKELLEGIKYQVIIDSTNK